MKRPPSITPAEWHLICNALITAEGEWRERARILKDDEQRQRAERAAALRPKIVDRYIGTPWYARHEMQLYARYVPIVTHVALVDAQHATPGCEIRD